MAVKSVSSNATGGGRGGSHDLRVVFLVSRGVVFFFLQLVFLDDFFCCAFALLLKFLEVVRRGRVWWGGVKGFCPAGFIFSFSMKMDKALTFGDKALTQLRFSELCKSASSTTLVLDVRGAIFFLLVNYRLVIRERGELLERRGHRRVVVVQPVHRGEAHARHLHPQLASVEGGAAGTRRGRCKL